MNVSVLVPSSLCRETSDKREATHKVGIVARAATIFRVDRLLIYDDEEGENQFDGGFVSTVLRYAVTPPYLRKDVWGQRPELEYAGVLPPLRAMSQTGSESNGLGSLRQGIVTEVGPEGRVRVNCGLQHPISLNVPSKMTVEEGERVPIRISSRRPVRAKIIDAPLPGIDVEQTDLSVALGREDAGIRIAASRFGERLTITKMESLAGLIQTDGMTIVFGAPDRGLPDILGIEADTVTTESTEELDGDGVTIEPTNDLGFDLWLNTVPDQGSEVIRTEEAMFASLACLTLRA